MNAKEFVNKYRNSIASKGGLYAIQNEDFNKARDYVKVGKSSSFVQRFTGKQGSSYSTAYPTGFQVKYLMSVPDHKSKFGDFTVQRIDRREKQLMNFLDEAGIPRAFIRANNSKPEWFKPDNVDEILNEGFKKVFNSTKEASTIWQCNKRACVPIKGFKRTYGKTRDDTEIPEVNTRARARQIAEENRRTTRSGRTR